MSTIVANQLSKLERSAVHQKIERPFGVIACCYLLANFFLFFNEGLFWDDWAVYNMSSEGIFQQFRGNGSPYFGYLHLWLNQLPNPPLVYSWLTVFLQLGTACCMWQIVRVLKLNEPFFFWVVLFATLIPYFSAKNTMICFPYTLGYFLFWAGFLLMALWISKGKLLYRLSALSLFFLSFTVNSLLVFYLLPFTLLYAYKSSIALSSLSAQWRRPHKLIDLKALFGIADFLLLPVVFFILKGLFFKPEGLYAAEGYNEIGLFGLLRSPALVVMTFIQSFLGLFKELMEGTLSSYMFVGFFGLVFLLLYLQFRKMVAPTIRFKPNLLLSCLFVGVLLFVLGAFPYALVGKIPEFWSYNTRHQLLLPLGASLMLVSVLCLLIRPGQLLIGFALFVAAFITTTAYQNLQFIKGFLKQESMAINFKENPTLAQFSTFIYVDYSQELNATERDHSFYNLNGIYKEAVGREDKLMIEYEEYIKLEDDLDKLMLEAERFNMKNYKPSRPQYLVKIDQGAYDLHDLNTIRLLFYKLFNEKAFRQAAENIITLDVSKYQEEEVDFYLENEE